MLKKYSIIRSFINHGVNYPTSLVLNYSWCFGFSLAMFLIIQIATGLILSTYYVSSVELAFDSVEYIMREVEYGWLIRYMHSNGASIFFILMYLHIGKAIFYGSYSRPRQVVWYVGVIIFVLSILTAFTGYILPWGQMSFRAATVITNIATVIPIIGTKIVVWLWGGYTVGSGTLKKFFILHFILPFIILLLVIIHISILHDVGSNNPTMLDTTSSDLVKFSPYFFLKDLIVFLVTLFVFFYFVSFAPNALGHPDNYIKANPMSTPEHIVPEWYFSAFYAILRSVPDKTGGVILMMMSIICLLILPKLNDSVYMVSSFYSERSQQLSSILLFAFLGLSWIGAMPAREPYISFGRSFVFIYFFFFFAVALVHKVNEKF